MSQEEKEPLANEEEPSPLADEPAPSPLNLTIETQLSLNYILANGLVFFTALTIRDYMTHNVEFIPSHFIPGGARLRKFVKLVITLVVVAALLVVINQWKRKIEEKERKRLLTTLKES